MKGAHENTLALLTGFVMSGAWLFAQAQNAVTPAISGVVDAGTPIVLIQDGFEAVEGPLALPDGGILFTNNRVGRILQVSPEGAVSTWYEGAGGANALTRTPGNEIVGTLTEQLAVGVVKPGEAPRVLVGEYAGTRLNRPNDLVADRRGNLYFTDTVPLTATAPPAIPSAVYELTARGELVRIDATIARPNGIDLSPDERTLYVANTTGEAVLAFELDRHGKAGKRRDFAKLALPPAQNGTLAGSGSDGLTVDEKGRVYVATTLGVQVFSPKGAPLGIIALPKQPQNLTFSERTAARSSSSDEAPCIASIR